MWATAASGLYVPAVSSQSIVHHDGHYASPQYSYEAGYYAAPVVQAPLPYAAPLAYSGHYDGHDEYVSTYTKTIRLLN